MFSGIVEEVGIVTEIIDYGTDIIMKIFAQKLSKELKTGESIAVNGCCLTVTEIKEAEFKVGIVAETINKTNLKYLKPASKVNLEGAITANQRIGGHFVQGHIANIAEIISIEDTGYAKLVHFTYPLSLAPYIVNKGYITLDGMSITLIEVTNNKFSVTFIPYTLENTIAHLYAPGSIINLEVDIIGRYIEKLINSKQSEAIYG